MKQTIAAVLAVAALATGCGSGVSAGGAAGGTVDVGVPVGGDAVGTRPSDDTLREEAQRLLGTREHELADDVRIGRRGDEQMMLTEDHVVGRFTVELDDDGSGTYTVTSVTVELADGVATFSV